MNQLIISSYLWTKDQNRFIWLALPLVFLISLLSLTSRVTLFPSTGDIVDANILGNLPLYFVSNEGQSNANVKFHVNSMGGVLFFTPEEIVLSLPPVTGPAYKETNSLLRLSFENANPNPTIVAKDTLAGEFNYLIGNDPEKWQTNVPSHRGVVYQNLYPGIDLEYDGTEGILKGTYTVNAGIDPSVIRWRLDGAIGLNVDSATGDLHIALTDDAILKELAPIAWQDIDGERIFVESSYDLAQDNSIGFKLGAYNTDYPLIIDPVLVYSSYIGGSSNDAVHAIEVDPAGNAYICGMAQSVVGWPPGTTHHGGTGDVFIIKLNAAGNGLIYGTLVGGSGQDSCYDLVLNDDGSLYFTGEQRSSDFPIIAATALDTTFNGTFDGNLTKLNAAGSALEYSTYIGGSAGDQGNSLAIDSQGNVYVVGLTGSPDIPTTPGAFSGPTTGISSFGQRDGFVAKIDPDAGSAGLLYFTYLGGSSDDVAVAIDVDIHGNALVSGSTSSSDFPTTPGAFDTSYNGSWDAFVLNLNSSGSGLVYSTYLGGSGDDGGGPEIKVDSFGNAYITGTTKSSDFPTTPGALYPNHIGGLDTFVTKLSPDGSSLMFSTYLGGSGFDDSRRRGIFVDANYDIYLSGVTTSPDFPVTPGAYQTTLRGGSDLWVALLDSTGSRLKYATYLGGSGEEANFVGEQVGWTQITVDTSGAVYITAAEILSIDFPTTAGAYDETYNTTRNSTVTKMYLLSSPIAEDNVVETDEDVAVPINLIATDHDGDVLRYMIKDSPVYGTLSGSAPNMTYTPNVNYFGTDSFTFLATDGELETNTATVAITMHPINDPPVAYDNTVVTLEDTAIAITLTGDDVEADPLSFMIVDMPVHGTLSGTLPEPTYTPNPDYFGEDSFTFKTHDGELDSNIATVNITVNPVNDAPVVSVDQSAIMVDEGMTAANSGSVSDVDGDAITLSASVGQVVDNGNGTWFWSYTTLDGPAQGNVTIRADDGHEDGVTETTFSLTVNNVPPTAAIAPPTQQVYSNTPFTLTATWTDPSGNTGQVDAPYYWGWDLNGDGTVETTGTDPQVAGDPAMMSNSQTTALIVPGTYHLSFQVIDKDQGVSNQAIAEVVVLAAPVQIDIKPGSFPNCFNNDGSGVIPVAILGNANFDVSLINPETVTLEGLAVRAVGKKGNLQAYIEDVNADGFADLVVQIQDQDGLFQPGDGTATLNGHLYDGTAIAGSDSICITQ